MTGDTVFRQYRFDFSAEVKENLKEFSQKNADLPRKDFKNAWTEWLDLHRLLLQTECETITKRGFGGDPLEKMYHSVRYYHRKPESKSKEKLVDKKSPESRTYVRLTDILHRIMDQHIESTLTKIINDPAQFQTTHAEAFTHFVHTNRSEILAELILMKSRDQGLEENMAQKLQKRYRDKYYKERLARSKILQI
jgi:hypothetical protein